MRLATYGADKVLDKALDRIKMEEPGDSLRKTYGGVSRCATRWSASHSFYHKQVASSTSPENNVQLREDAVEGGAGATCDRQYDPVVSLGPGHLVGFCCLCSLCLDKSVLLGCLGPGRRFFLLFNDARFWCSSMTWCGVAKTGVWFFPGWAALTKHFACWQG